jgi:hypothetical protein
VNDDVLGTVVDGSPAGLTVRVGTTTTTTDAWGRFVIRGAPAVYDVAMARNQGARAYFGLTSRRPLFYTTTRNGPRSSPLNITYPDPTVVNTQWVAFSDVAVLGSDDNGGLGTPQSLQTTLYWVGDNGGPTTKVTLTGVAFTAPPSAPPAHYLGYATASFEAQDGVPITWSPPKPTPMTERTVTGTATADATQTIYEVYLLVRFSSEGGWAMVNRAGALTQPPYSFIVPNIPGASFAMEYSAYDTGAPGSVGGANSTMSVAIGADGSVPAVTVPAAPAITAPAQGATGFGVGSTIAWTGEGVCVVSLTNYAIPGSPSIDLVSGTGSATLPDLSALGVSLPKLETYNMVLTCEKTSEPWAGDPALLPLQGMLGVSGYSTLRSVTTR